MPIMIYFTPKKILPQKNVSRDRVKIFAKNFFIWFKHTRGNIRLEQFRKLFLFYQDISELCVRKVVRYAYTYDVYVVINHAETVLVQSFLTVLTTRTQKFHANLRENEKNSRRCLVCF